METPAWRGRNVLWHLGLVHAWGTVETAGWNALSWSICAEWFAYLLFSFLARALWRIRSRAAAFGLAGLALVATSFAILAAGWSLNSWLGVPALIRVTGEFIAGAALCRAIQLADRTNGDAIGFLSLGALVIAAIMGILGWLVSAGIAPQIPVWDKSTREDGTFSRSDFTFDRERNVYVCPAGKLLTTTGNVGDDHILRYLASKRDCDACRLKQQCCPKMLFRKVTRDINEDARDLARALMGTPEFDKSRDERKKVEMRFAHLKTHHRFERMRLRGLSGARDEFHLAAIVQNLKTLANHFWRPPPNAMTA